MEQKSEGQSEKAEDSVQKTVVADAVKAAVTDPKTLYDRATKRLLSEAMILAFIVKSTVSEAAEMSIEEIADRIRHAADQGPDAEGTPQLEATAIGNIVCDVIFTVSLDEETFIRINVEAQNDSTPGYSLITRAVAYGCQLVAQQTELWAKHSKYDNICKVYTIWLVSNAARNLQGQVLQLELYGNRYFVDGSKEQFLTVPEADKLNIVMAYLPDVERADEVSQSWLSVFSVLFSTKSSKRDCERVLREHGVAVESEMEEEIAKMCTLGQGIVDSVTKSVTKSVTESVTKSVTAAVTEAVSKEKDKEFATKLEKLEQERERDREQLAMGLMSEGLSIGTVAKYLKLPLSVIQALAAKQAGHSASGGCLA